MTPEELKSQLDALNKRLDEIPPYFGKRFTNALASPNYKKGTSGWYMADNGDVEFGSGTFRGTLTSGGAGQARVRINGTNQSLEFIRTDDSVAFSIISEANNNILTFNDITGETRMRFLLSDTGDDLELLNAGSRFLLPADGMLGWNSGINLSLEADNSRKGDEWQLSVGMGPVVPSSSNTVTTKIPILVNGVQYFLLATTSSSPSSPSPSLSASSSVSPSSSISPSKSPSVSPS
jgi:hypothetical protein